MVRKQKVKFKANILLCCILIFTLVIAGAWQIVFKSGENKGGDNLERTITQEECGGFAENYIIGLWKYQGNEEYPLNLLFEIMGDGRFNYKEEDSLNRNNETFTGTWNYSDGLLTLDFDNLNSNWDELLATESLLSDFPSLIAYDKEKIALVFEIGYASRDNFTICEKGRYYIDFFNTLLYKQVD